MSDTTKAGELAFLGKLIAEISKFGGASKEDASRLARILLPHIDSYAAQERTKLVDELISKLPDPEAWTMFGHPSNKEFDAFGQGRARALDQVTQLLKTYRSEK